MSDNAIELPAHTVEAIDEALAGADGPVRVIVANGENGLEVQVADIKGAIPAAFPPRTAATRVVTDTASFTAEVTRRPLLEGKSTVWGNRQKGEVTAIYDELDANATSDYTRRADSLILRFVPDPDWATLHNAADGAYHDQDEFGDLIESTGHLITSHPAAELMEIVDSVRASKSGSFESRIRRDTGSQHLSYSEDVTAKAGTAGTLEVPRTITLKARPFEDYPEVEVTCWLRLRISQGKLYLGLFPKPYQHLVRDAWTKVTDDLAEAIKVPVYASNVGR